MRVPPSPRPPVLRRRSLRRLAVALACLPFIPACEVPTAEDPSAFGQPIADFEQDRTEGPLGMEVQFTDTSSGHVTTWVWDFGPFGASNERHPRVRFDRKGVFSVTLTVSGPEGASTVAKSDLIAVHDPVLADFECAPLVGTAPLTVTCTDRSANVTGWSWDFGDGATSTARSPSHTYASGGRFPIELVASGPGGSSRAGATVDVAWPPVVAGFTCVPKGGYLPLTVTCVDGSVNASAWSWSYGDGTTSTEQNPGAKVYDTAGDFEITLSASNPGGVSQHTTTLPVRELLITPDVPSGTGAAALEVTFTPDAADLPADLFQWKVDGKIVSNERVLVHRFTDPGIHSLELTAGNIREQIHGTVAFEYEVLYADPVADFHPSVDGGTGPLTVRFLDDSFGTVARWQWDFGDGTSCVHPAAPEIDESTCDSREPTHIYDEIGLYDVTLSVTAPEPEGGGEAASDAIVKRGAVRVYLIDPSFELQSTSGPISGAWEHLPPVDPDWLEETTRHRALQRTPLGDHGMPSAGEKWAVLDGLGTDGSTPVGEVQNGIRQDFFRPPDRPVLELDVALLYNEPAASPIPDAVTVTVSYGPNVVELPSAWADPTTPYVGTSQRFPERDGNDVRITAALTASIDLSDPLLFPGADDETRFTLTIRVANGANSLRSPRAYVDNVRFVERGDALNVKFSLHTGHIADGERVAIVGEPVSFLDETCPKPAQPTCTPPTSWRWDFGTHGALTPPVATGSGERHPSYVYQTPGSFDVTLEAHLGELEGEATQVLNVIAAPEAVIQIVTEAPFSAPLDIAFRDASASDPLDPIVAWRWDFGGWGTSSLQDPDPVRFPQVGTFVVTLEVETGSGVVARTEQTLVVE